MCRIARHDSRDPFLENWLIMEQLRLIAGSGRSGTTWVLDTMAEANEMRPVFEPLHPTSCEIARRMTHAYLTREVESDDLKKFLMSVAIGEWRSIWTSYRVVPIRLTGNHFRSIRPIKKLIRSCNSLAYRYWHYRERERRLPVLVKCIRANLMLDWIHANFDARIVLLMRHPCAVVESRLRFSESWNPYRLLTRYRNDQALMHGPLSRQAELLHQDLSAPEALAAIWCIENVIPASQAARNGYHVVFYEEMLEQPETQWPRVARALGMAVVPETELRKQPSQQSAIRLRNEDTKEDSYSESYASWRERLPTADLHQIEAVLEAFGVRFYSVSESRPNVELFAREYLSI